MISATRIVDVLKTEGWTNTNCIPGDLPGLNGDFSGWLEGDIVNILRVDLPHQPEKAAIMTISADGLLARFDPEKGLIDFPGGTKKYSLRFDHHSGYCWSLINYIKPEFEDRKIALVANVVTQSIGGLKKMGNPFRFIGTP